MRLRIKFAAVLQLMLIAGGLLTAGFLPSEGGHLAGCPLHRQSSPSAPVKDHSCCQSGHEAAVAEKPAIPDHDFARSPLLDSDEDPVSFYLSRDLLTGLVPAATPPRNLPIRI